MLNKLRSYFFSITLLVTFSASAQDLEEIYQLVLQADPRLLMEEANLGINKAQEQQAFGNLLPQVTITSDWTETKRVTEQTSEDSYKGERHNLIITQPIINMPTYYRWKGSKDNVSRYEMSLKDIQSRVRFDTIERYFKLLSSMDALALVSEEKIMTEKKETQTKVTIDNIEYNISDLSDNAKSQMQGMQVAINEIKRLDIQKALVETARNAYGQALSADLPEPAAEK